MKLSGMGLMHITLGSATLISVLAPQGLSTNLTVLYLLALFIILVNEGVKLSYAQRGAELQATLQAILAASETNAAALGYLVKTQQESAA